MLDFVVYFGRFFGFCCFVFLKQVKLRLITDISQDTFTTFKLQR